MSQEKTVAVIGSGPAGLMVADQLSARGVTVRLYEKRKLFARKLLIAGSSGLNVTNTLPFDEFVQAYTGGAARWREWIEGFSPEAWQRYLEDLGQETFVGTSGRVFVREMKAAKVLRAWTERLKSQGVQFFSDHEWRDATREVNGRWRLDFVGHESEGVDAACLALGGGSYESGEQPLRWVQWFLAQQIEFQEFTPSNAGFEVAWSEAFVAEADGLPLKNIALTTARGRKKGDLVVTRYGLEGTPIYSLGEIGPAWLDLKPDLTRAQIILRLSASRENLSPIRRAKKSLGLSAGAQALIFHHAPASSHDTIEELAEVIENFPLQLLQPRPLDEAISARGGVSLDAVDEKLMLREHPGIFVVGEMLDWDAPTGGWLIQGCVSQAVHAAKGMMEFLERSP